MDGLVETGGCCKICKFGKGWLCNCILAKVCMLRSGLSMLQFFLAATFLGDFSIDDQNAMLAVELRGFAILFLVELLVRVGIQRCTYFRSCWNWFDVRDPG